MNIPKFAVLLSALVLCAPGAGRAELLNLAGSTEFGDGFGYAVTTGNFNCDGYEDLAVGVPYEDDSVGGSSTGAVNIIYGGTGSGGKLGTPGNQVFIQGDFTPAVSLEYFGRALASGDFNSDGCDDLAIGIPFDQMRGISGAGGIVVLYGAPSGFRAGVNQQHWDQDSAGIPGVAETNDHFGMSLAAGDFNNDGYDDLAIGSSYESVGSLPAVGAVNVLYGSASRLTANGSQIFHPSSSPSLGTAQSYEHFGSALAAGDFDGNGYDDLAIGVHGRDFSGINSGAVRVLYAYNSAGLSTTNTQLWNWGSLALAGDGGPHDNSNFGRALAAGDFNGDNRADLAIGIPEYRGGAVQVLYGSTSRLSSTGSLFLHRDIPGVAGTREEDTFGLSLAAGDLNNDTRDDLVVGAPEDTLDETDYYTSQVGTIQVFYGSSAGVSVSDILLDQGDVGGYTTPELWDHFGFAVATGDFNGDGFADVVAGAPDDSMNTNDSGIGHVIYSNSQGINITDTQTLIQ